jgi:LytR cell envelope-related transcriptional attenuator
MSEDSPFQGQPSYVAKSSNKKRLVVVFLVVFLLVIAGLGALYLLGSTTKKAAKPATTMPLPTEVMSTPTPEATSSAKLSVTPTATSSASAIDPATLKVSVLNGSGTPGAAGKIATALKTAGFTNVTTGNAKEYTYKGLTVTVKKKAYLSQVQKAVAADSSMKVTTSVDTSLLSDIEVIVGK